MGVSYCTVSETCERGREGKALDRCQSNRPWKLETAKTGWQSHRCQLRTTKDNVIVPGDAHVVGVGFLTEIRGNELERLLVASRPERRAESELPERWGPLDRDQLHESGISHDSGIESDAEQRCR